MKNYLFFIILLFSASFIACDHEDVKPNSPTTGNPNNPSTSDSTKPSIYLSSPDDNSSLMVIETLTIRANITDNGGLKEVRVSVVDSNGTNVQLHGSYVLTSFDREGSLSFSIHDRFALGIATSIHKLIVEAEDKHHNVAKDTISILVSAPDLNAAEFSRIFTNNGYFVNYMTGWDYYVLIESGVTAGFVYVLDRDRDNKILKAEWEKFITDFEISRQNWSVWDVNGDGYLTGDEFINGFKETKLFQEWDKDKDAELSDEEFASGVFSRWDSNKNGKLNRTEYEEKVHSYFY